MKTVALVEIGNGGHHTAYMRLFIEALLKLNCRVICMIPDTEPIESWVREQVPELAHQVIYRPLPFYRERFKFLGRYRERLNILYDWYNINRVVEDTDRQFGITTDLVFLCFLDLYLVNRVSPRVLDLLMPKNWSGLYFFPAQVTLQPALLQTLPLLKHRDILFRARNCVGIGLLNNSLHEKYSARLGKPVIPFPDVADTSRPDDINPIAASIRDKAQGRIVIGTIGLEWHKCGFELIQLAQHADANRFFFAFTGPFHDSMLSHYPEEQARVVRHFMENLPENCYWNTGFLHEGGEYNAVFDSFDIIWTVYKNFYGSSNRLTKAAYFHKFVISGSQYCIGELVNRFGLGESLPDLELSTMLAALDKLEQRIKTGDLPIHNWNEYARLQHPDVLQDRFARLLALLPHENDRAD